MPVRILSGVDGLGWKEGLRPWIEIVALGLQRYQLRWLLVGDGLDEVHLLVHVSSGVDEVATLQVAVQLDLAAWTTHGRFVLAAVLVHG